MKLQSLTIYLYHNQTVTKNSLRLLLIFENVKSVKKALELMKMMG